MRNLKPRSSPLPAIPARAAGIINRERLAHVTSLSRGRHDPGNKMCALEAAAYIAGEPWSDQPQCTSHIIARFLRSWNDALPDDATRDRLLLPLIPKIVNTHGSAQLEHQRAMMAADWLIRTHAVTWLRLAKLDPQANTLASLPPITVLTRCSSLVSTLVEVRDQTTAARAATKLSAWADALEAARNTASTAVADAAADAARRIASKIDAANDTGITAGNTGGHAASTAARWAFAWTEAADASWAISWDAAWVSSGHATPDALQETVTHLQSSAIALIERMAALKDPDEDIDFQNERTTPEPVS